MGMVEVIIFLLPGLLFTLYAYLSPYRTFQPVCGNHPATAGVFDRAWSPLLRPQRLPTPPPQSELVAGTKGGKGGGGDKQKSAAGGKGKKAAPGENAISDEGVPPPPPMEVTL